jgi:hypothetical protein
MQPVEFTPVEFTPEPKSSIEVSRLAKGNYTWKIKLYFNEDGYGVVESIELLDKELRKRFK